MSEFHDADGPSRPLAIAISDEYATAMSAALAELLGRPAAGTIAFTRSLARQHADALIDHPGFAIEGWDVAVVADVNDPPRRLTADRAVEVREDKADRPTLFLIDPATAGAGLDGIYNAGRELREEELLTAAREAAFKRVKHGWTGTARAALKQAKRAGRRGSVTPWAEFDFAARCAASPGAVGGAVAAIGLWPVVVDGRAKAPDAEIWSRAALLADRLLGGSSAASPRARVESLRLRNSEADLREVEDVARRADTGTPEDALLHVVASPQLWLGPLRPEFASDELRSLAWKPWRSTKTKRLVKWSGLTDRGDELPAFALNPEADGNEDRLEVRWETDPADLPAGAVEYTARVVAGDDVLAERVAAHTGRAEQKVRFTNEDFADLEEHQRFEARVEVSVVGGGEVTPVITDEFLLCFDANAGDDGQSDLGAGSIARCAMVGAIALDADSFEGAKASWTGDGRELHYRQDKKGFVTFRPVPGSRACRIARSPMLAQLEEAWAAFPDDIGRWTVTVRGDGMPAGAPQFVSLGHALAALPEHDRVRRESRKFLGPAFAAAGGLTGEVYSDAHPSADNYLLAWEKLLEAAAADPDARTAATLAHTLEVRTQSGHTVGLVVLPSHPVRVAWHVGHDRLLQHARYEIGMSHAEASRELMALDGAQFPSCLPGQSAGTAFVFADMLGFHAAAMVAHDEAEPRAAVARLAACYGGGSAEFSPAVGERAGTLLGRELTRFAEFYSVRRSLHVHAIRPGDARTVARALGDVLRESAAVAVAEDGEKEETGADVAASELTFELQLFPSPGVPRSGRFLSDVLERRRSGAGGIDGRDRWMLESVSRPGGTTLPRLRWARRGPGRPEDAAHVAVAFDTFDSRVESAAIGDLGEDRPSHVFGLLARAERQHDLAAAEPNWASYQPPQIKGEAHPAGAIVGRRLQQIHAAVMRIAGSTADANRGEDGCDGRWPVLRTRLASGRREDLRNLHELADWVVTIDRNVGVEFFDAPREAGDVYEAYVIDCVPERDDLGNMQLVTSTARTEDVRRLLDGALDRMGLSASDRNARFLLGQLKALSGRLAMRLTNPSVSSGELVALALVHASCTSAAPGQEEGWLNAAGGFFVPLDDVRDLDPPAVGRARRKSDAPAEGDASGNDDPARRADLLFIAPSGRSGLALHFVEVKYRRHLGSASSPALAAEAAEQADAAASRWREYYFGKKLDAVRRAVRVSRLAAALRFYADKARRHRLSDDAHRRLVAAIDRLVLGPVEPDWPAGGNRVYAFCPEFAGTEPKRVPLPEYANGEAYVFGPSRLPETVAALSATMARGNGGSPHATDEPGVSDHNADEPSVNVSVATGGRSNFDSGDSVAEPATKSERAGGNLVGLTTADDSVEPPAAASSPASASRASGELEVRLGTRALGGDPVGWNVSIRANPHLMLVGLPGMGKTTCLLNLCRQFAAGGVTPVIFSYHQDFDEKIAGPLPNTRFLRPDQLGFNPLRVERPAPAVHIDSAGMMRDIFAGIYPDLGDIQLGRIRTAVKASYEAIGWGGDVLPEGSPAPDFRDFYELLRGEDKPDAGLLSRLSELDDYGVFAGAGAGRRLLEDDAPAVLQIHVNQNEVVQRAFASLLLYGLYQDMFRRGPQERITHAVIFDEAHRASRLRLLPTMAKECRKYGIALVLASQEAKDFDDSLYSAVANYLSLRVTENDAKAVARHCVAADLKAHTTDRLKALPKYEALFFREGAGRPSHVRLDP